MIRLKNMSRNEGTNDYRNELKYICTEGELFQIETRIAPLCRKDIHAGTNGGYEVRSIYFDDNENRSYYENENGISPREKFRVRMYDADPSFLNLECKKKENNLTHKESCSIKKEILDEILNGNAKMDIGFPPLLVRFILQFSEAGLRPKVIVAYERTPFVYDMGNVRITFDRNIAGCTDIGSFYNKRIMTRPILQKGQHILEVKYNYVFPEILYRIMNIKNLRQTTFSKYYFCRKYTEQGEKL